MAPLQGKVKDFPYYTYINKMYTHTKEFNKSKVGSKVFGAHTL